MEKSFSGGGFGLSWGTLKRFWEPLGVVGPSWTSWGPGGPPGVRRFGPNLGPKMEPKWRKNRCKNRSNNLMHLGIDFGVDLEAFWKPKWSHVGTQINQTSMPLAKNEFLKNHCFSFRKNHYFEGSRDPSWEQKSTKNCQKRDATWESILASIL